MNAAAPAAAGVGHQQHHREDPRVHLQLPGGVLGVGVQVGRRLREDVRAQLRGPHQPGRVDEGRLLRRGRHRLGWRGRGMLRGGLAGGPGIRPGVDDAAPRALRPRGARRHDSGGRQGGTVHGARQPTGPRRLEGRAPRPAEGLSRAASLTGGRLGPMSGAMSSLDTQTRGRTSRGRLRALDAYLCQAERELLTRRTARGRAPSSSTWASANTRGRRWRAPRPSARSSRS